MKAIFQLLFLAVVLAGIVGCQPNLPANRSAQTEAPEPASIGTSTRFTFHTITPGPAPTQTSPPRPASTSEQTTATNTPAVHLSAQGPWLLYVHNSPRPGMYDVPDIDPEFVLLNQDGSGRTPITLLGCNDGELDNFLMNRPNSAGYISQNGPQLYLIQPSDATGILLYEMRMYPACQTFFNGSEKGGLLASIHQAAAEAVPELVIYELPGGKIRDRLPLVKCETDVNACEEVRALWRGLGNQKPRWSSNGRYLAFAAILEAASSDLFVYDSQNGSLRRLTQGPDWVGPIEWSPDGTQILMQEFLHEEVFNNGLDYGPSSVVPSSVWSVSVNTNEIKLLYLTGDAHAQQNILRWLDEKRFLAYQGFLDPMDMALNLRVVDTDAGTNRILFDDLFVMESFDPNHETLALFKLETETSPQGIYLVSIRDGIVRRLEEPPYVPDFQWDAESGWFVSRSDCQDDPQSLQAFDHQGNFRCVPKPAPTPATMEAVRYPSPNGKWSLSVKDGLWLEADGQPEVQVSPETATDLIWCPDSSCFFFSVSQQDQQQQALYRVSVPDLFIKMVDEGIQSTGSFQWLGAEE